MIKRIKVKDYNEAREILEEAGSDSASKSHKKHAKDKDCPAKDGRSLLEEARCEFQEKDRNELNLVDGITESHRQALQSAADKMGLE